MEAMDPVRYEGVSFEPLKAEHLGLINDWLGEPHVTEFYAPRQLQREAIYKKYLGRTDPASPTRAFLIRVEIPIGYIQTYRLCDWPEYAATIGEAGGISLDLFIGDPQFVGRGWGRRILLAFLNQVAFPLFPAETVCWISHDVGNHRALRASQAAGFQRVRQIVEDGTLKELSVVSRSDAVALAERFLNECGTTKELPPGRP
jgi:aminoglycoside 6'-N-acetyltransferase